MNSECLNLSASCNLLIRKTLNQTMRAGVPQLINTLLAMGEAVERNKDLQLTITATLFGSGMRWWLDNKHRYCLRWRGRQAESGKFFHS